MKIRIKDNSIRLRLTQTEVTRFGEKGIIISSTRFGPGNQFEYALQASTDTEAIYGSFDHNRITVHVPAELAKQWTTSQEVGFEAVMDNDTESGLYLLVEKDFACLMPRTHEDESDNFPNPQAR